MNELPISMAPKYHPVIFVSILLVFIQFQHSDSQSWIKAGYWYVHDESPIPQMDSSLFTHLICASMEVNSSTYQLSFPSGGEYHFSVFTSTVRRKNPSVVTLLSVWDGQSSTREGILGEKTNFSALSSVLQTPLHRRSFIQSSIRISRLYGFQGIDLNWLWPAGASDMVGIGILLDEWRAAVNSESRTSSQPPLILTMAVPYSPAHRSLNYPIESMRRNLDWAHILAYDYHLPSKERVTKPHASLYDPLSHVNTDYGVREWLRKGFPDSKLVLGLPFHGYAWNLENSKVNAIGSPSLGLAESDDGSMSYLVIKQFIRSYGAVVEYNATYVVNHCTVGSSWINFDDVEAIKAKVNYAKEKKLLGYSVFLVPNDENDVLSRAASQVEDPHRNQHWILLVVLLPSGLIVILLASVLFFRRTTIFKSQGATRLGKSLSLSSKNASYRALNLQVFSLSILEAATDKFSSENKLGEGGFGPVYKGKLQRGDEVAVKRLSKSSTQGVEEFMNEVTLTARLQHVNLVRVLGLCTEKEEKMLIYEYMPNKSLDLYLFDPIRRYELDWRQRVRIIEGIIQGLLYLQEYSNFTIIHRDIKASNILLDLEMMPKISDFGMAKLFKKDEVEANTSHIVGTYGYVPPEYVRKGIYSIKYDVYSFGVLLLQIISGKRSACYFGLHENMTLLDYAYELWKENRGMDFFDQSLDDTSTPCKLMTCLQVALLCVQESPKDRPSILEVNSMLKSGVGAIASPKKPAFSLKGGEASQNRTREPISQQEVFSINETQMSQLMPR